jgi:VanZ family protein
MKLNFKNLIRFLPSVLWMAVIFYFSSRSTTGIINGQVQSLLFFKSLHLIEYAILGIFLYLAFKKYQYSVLIAYLYSLSDEFHQRFVPGREGKISDTFIDLVGILIGSLIIREIIKLTH